MSNYYKYIDADYTYTDRSDGKDVCRFQEILSRFF